MRMNLVQLAKDRCANWNDSNGRCFGWSVEQLCGAGPVKELDHCRLKDGEPCEYFERCIIDSKAVKKDDPEAFFHYRQELRQIQAKRYIQRIENKEKKVVILPGSLGLAQERENAFVSPLKPSKRARE